LNSPWDANLKGRSAREGPQPELHRRSAREGPQPELHLPHFLDLLDHLDRLRGVSDFRDEPDFEALGEPDPPPSSLTPARPEVRHGRIRSVGRFWRGARYPVYVSLHAVAVAAADKRVLAGALSSLAGSTGPPDVAPGGGLGDAVDPDGPIRGPSSAVCV
jgi:hypothetical protein